MKPRAAARPAAIAYVSALHDHDGSLTGRLIEFGRRRGYGMLAIVLQWTAVRHLLDGKHVNVVVMPPREYGTPAGCEHDDEITQSLSRPAAHNRETTASRFVTEVRAAATCAVIYLPPSSPVDGPMAQRCLVHVEARGYQLAGIVRTREEIGRCFRTGVATVAVLARREHWDPLWEPRIEVAAEEQCDPARPQLLARKRNEGAQHRERPQLLR